MSLEEVEGRVAEAAARAGRDPDEVTIVAISKGQPLESVRVAWESGQSVFGENRAKELAERAAVLPPEISWHFVGRLQTNKARIVRPIADLLHSLDRESLIEAWMKGRGLPPPALLQVNLSGEPQQGGVGPSHASQLLERASGAGIRVKGLMAMAPLGPAEQARRVFGRLAALREELGRDHPDLTELSMGMSDDYEAAVEEGSTMVRIGRAIFGPRTG